MGDYNVRLSQLHRRVAEQCLGASASIDEYGWIQCQHADIGEFEIILREYNPELLKISWRFFDDASAPRDLLLAACNSVNESEDAKLHVSESYSVVRAEMALLLAPKGSLPSEELLRAVLPHALSKLIDAANALMTELENRTATPPAKA